MPQIWHMYVNLFTHPLCLPVIQYTHAQRTFDCALLTLPPSLHAHIWPQYLVWAELKGGMATVVIYQQYLAIDLSLTEHYVSLLLHGCQVLMWMKLKVMKSVQNQKHSFSFLYCHPVTLGSPRYGQGPLGPADIRSATRLPPQPPGPPGVPLRIWGQ